MSMTAKDFQALAASIRDTREANIVWVNPGFTPMTQGLCEAINATTKRTFDAMAREIANILAKQNPKFDRARFLRECGVES